jgi:hypothetical protein
MSTLAGIERGSIAGRMDTERRSYWDLVEDIARLQAQTARSFTSWSAAYTAAGEAAEATAETLRLMAEVGRRVEQFWTQPPDASVAQALQLLTQPWQALGMPFAAFPGTSAASFLERPRSGQAGSKK